MAAPTSWVVLKFGGTSVAGRAQWDIIAGLARERQADGFRVLLVCSAIAGVTNVKGVTNEVAIGAISSFSARSNDTYITSKVKARFIDANKFQVNHVKVVTEAGTVFLLGMVTRKEADVAAEIARTTADVKKVVRVFEYVVIREKPQADKPPEEGK